MGSQRDADGLGAVTVDGWLHDTALANSPLRIASERGRECLMRVVLWLERNDLQPLRCLETRIASTSFGSVRDYLQAENPIAELDAVDDVLAADHAAE